MHKTYDLKPTKKRKVLLVGGNNNMSGSINLTTKACYNSEVRLCEVVTTKKIKKTWLVIFQKLHLQKLMKKTAF